MSNLSLVPTRSSLVVSFHAHACGNVFFYSDERGREGSNLAMAQGQTEFGHTREDYVDAGEGHIHLMDGKLYMSRKTAISPFEKYKLAPIF